MENREVTIMEVLNFREKKSEIQKKMYFDDPKGVVVSLGMNIPGPVKSGSSVYHAFCEGKKQLLQMILNGKGDIVKEQMINDRAGYAAVYLVKGIEREKLKEAAVYLEETHLLGRIFDIDILKKNLETVSRIEIGKAGRKCLLCSNDAKVCGRSRTHTVEELQKKTAFIISAWEKLSR